MKLDLVIAGAIINDSIMIRQAIDSCPDYNYNEKYILFDGLSNDRTFDEHIRYQEYKNNIKYLYPDFKVIEFKECIYFRNMIKGFSKISVADKFLVVQDDVILPKFNLTDAVDLMNTLSDCKILCFPHKVIDVNYNWFEIIETSDTPLLSATKTHGFTERTFLCDKDNILNICETMPSNNKNNKRFTTLQWRNIRRVHGSLRKIL